jgi:hypothetical protein
MKHGAAVVSLCAILVAGNVLAAEGSSKSSEEVVPRTFNGAGQAFREGGRQIGAGFRALGRGVRDTFTGKRSADDYRGSKQIGSGFKDVGRGVAGEGRAVGRAIKQGVRRDE